MASGVIEQELTEQYAIYNGDCIEVMQDMPSNSVHMSIYSPPFCGLYHYTSSERDLSNCRSYEEFFLHYGFVVSQIHRLTLPGRITAVHCMDVRADGANLNSALIDFSGDIIRLHESLGFQYCARYHIWKEPLEVRNRTMIKGLMHQQVVRDSVLCDVASADYLLMFRKKGENKIPVTHPQGLMSYAGSRDVPHDLLRYRGYKGKQTENRYSHWIWRQYASSFWDDVRIDRVLPFKEAKDSDDERHVHPLQLDVVERGVVLWSNPGETILTPFLGVGSEAYGAIINDRRAIGAELKPSYYRQARLNIRAAVAAYQTDQVHERDLFSSLTEEQSE